MYLSGVNVSCADERSVGLGPRASGMGEAFAPRPHDYRRNGGHRVGGKVATAFCRMGSAAYLGYFWGLVREQEDGCWVWIGSRTQNGYGQTSIGGTRQKPHRIAWSLANAADIPTGFVVCHRCDNPPCSNPAHLFLGTSKDNHDDSLVKRRRWYQSRTHCRSGRHELTPETTQRRGNTIECTECRRERDREAWPARRARKQVRRNSESVVRLARLKP